MKTADGPRFFFVRTLQLCNFTQEVLKKPVKFHERLERLYFGECGLTYFRGLKIRSKLLLSLGCLFALLILVAGITHVGSVNVSTYRKRAEAAEKRIVALTDFRSLVRNRILETYDVIFVEQIDDSPKLVAAEAAIDKSIELLKFAEGPGNIGPDLEKDYRAIDDKLDSVVVKMRAGKKQEAHELLAQLRQRNFNENFINSVNKLIAVEKDRDNADRERIRTSVDVQNKVVVGISIFGAVLTIFLAYFLSRSIARKLITLESAADQISAGNFDIQLPVPGQDELSRLALAFNEMTQSLRTAKAQLADQQAMLMVTSKMSALGEMAGGVAHEINTPLATITLIAEQIHSKVRDEEMMESREDVFALVEIIQKTTDKIAKIVRSLKDFSRDGAKDPLESVDINGVVEDVLSLCRNRLEEDHIELRLRLSPVPIFTSCRPTQISHVLLNLLGNSQDAIRGTKGAWIELAVEATGDMVRVAVADSGPGIPAEIRDKIMQPFFSTKDIGAGTGLGLSTSLGIIQSHGGRLALDPSAAHTSFYFTLPQRRAA
jgi:signal transduction histidine kinase